jgi:hypothetical protein
VQRLIAHRDGAIVEIDEQLAGADCRVGMAKAGRLWVYLRDERPHAGPAPPTVIYRYSADRKGEVTSPLEHLVTRMRPPS